MDSVSFTKIHIKLQLPEACYLPRYKVSAIRGGMGQMLLAQNCIRDGDCSSCSFTSSCIVRNILYTPSKIKLPSATTDESMGYVIDCTDMGTSYSAGDSIIVDFTLFGDAISYVMPIIYALTSLGCAGLGKDKAKFYVTEITNRYHKPVLKDGNIYMKNILTETVGQYVTERMKHQSGSIFKVKLKTPCAVKFQGEFIKEFNGRSFVISMLQKMHMYQMYEGKEVEKDYWDDGEFPVISRQHMQEVTVPRYSSTQNKKMWLCGIQGILLLESCNKKVQELLYAMEILHLGKNTRLGFGKVQVENEK